MIKFTLAAVAALALVPAAGHAAPTSVSVDYSDLDLTSTQGQAELKHRIATAAQTICGRPDYASSVDRDMNRACRNTIVSNSRTNLQVAVARSFSDRDRLAAR